MAYTRQMIYRMEDQLEQVVNQLDSYNYYQLLGIDPQSAKELIEFTFIARVKEYEEIRALKICPAALYQNLGKLLERLEEARRVLLDDQARAEYHDWLRAGHTRHFGQQAVKPREVEKKDEFLEAAARHLQRKIGDRYTHAAEEEIHHAGTWSIDLGEGENLEAKDIDEVQEHLRREMDRLGVYDEVGEEDQSASLDAEYLADTQEGLRRELDGYGVYDEVGEEDSSAALDIAYLSEAEEHLRKKLKRDGVNDEAPPDDESATLDMAYLEQAEQYLEAQIAGDKPLPEGAKPITSMTPRERAMALRREAFRASQTGEQPRLPPSLEARKRAAAARRAATPGPRSERMPTGPRPGAPRPSAPRSPSAQTAPQRTPSAPIPQRAAPPTAPQRAAPPTAPQRAAPPTAPRSTGQQPAKRPVGSARPPARPAPASKVADDAPIDVIQLDDD